MKNLLIASTALVATAGVAAADVALSGRAEMGIFKTSGVDAQFFTDIDVTFTMSGETDNGLTFGASVDLDEGGAGAPAVANNADDGGATIFISGSFGTVTMGDTDGALDWALTEAGNVGNPGSIADDETGHAGYLGSYADGSNDGQILRWDYTTGAFGVAISVEDDNGSAVAGVSPGYAIGFKYAMDLGGTTVNLGLGYQKADIIGTAKGFNNFLNGAGALNTGDDVEIVGVSADATFANGISAGISYAAHEFTIGGASIDIDHIGLGVGYTTGALSLHMNYGQFDPDTAALPDSAGFGLSAAYDLGGGAVIHAGYSRDDIDGSAFDFQRASLGLGLSF